MPEITNEEIKQVYKKIEYIGLDLNKIPSFLKKNKMTECNLEKEYRDTTYKVYRYVDVNDIQIFITTENDMANIQKKCKNAKTLGEYVNDEDYKQSFLNMVQDMDFEKIMELENEQNKFDISYPYGISYKNALKWRVFRSSDSKKYFMMVSSTGKDNEAMLLLLKKQIQSNKEKIAIKIFIPIANEGFSEKFLNNSQITDVENDLWFFTKKWPSVYEVVDIYGNRSMHIIGKNIVYENVESFYKIFIRDKKEANEKYELLKELFLIESNLKDKYHFNIKIDEKGLFQIFINEQEISLDNMNEFLNKQSEEKIEKTKEIIDSIEKIQIELGEKKEELEKKNEEYNLKQKQIVTFLQCKRTFLGRFKYFFKSNKKNKRIINRLPQVQKVEVIADDVIKEIYEKKDFYYIEDLITVCNILDKYIKDFETKKNELKTATEKIEILKQKIKNADLFISEIESHKHSIFEFWKFTNKDVPNELTEAEKKHISEEEKKEKKFVFTQDIEKLENQMDNMQVDKLSKNEMDAIFLAKNYINLINVLCKKELEKEDEKYINNVLEEEKQNYIREKSNKNIIYYDAKQNINIHTKEEKQNIVKDKYEILNYDLNMDIQNFKDVIIKTKKILEKAYNKINIPYNIPLYSVLKNNQVNEWSLANLDLQQEIKNEKNINVDIIKYNVPKGSSVLFYTNHVLYTNNDNNNCRNLKDKKVLLNINEFELSLNGKHKERIIVENDNYENFVKTIKIYEYNLNPKKEKEEVI